MKKLFSVLFMVVTVCTSVQAKTFDFDNHYESTIEPNGNVTNFKATNDEDGAYAFTINCENGKNVALVEKLNSKNDLFGPKTLVARTVFDAERNCLATSKRLYQVVGGIESGIARVIADEKKHHIYRILIFRSDSEMDFKD